jgi:hypothetical protein
MRNQEFTMRWPDVVKASAAAVSRDRASGDEETVIGTQAAGWDPYEVWLSRIKKPRDRAAVSLAACDSSLISDLPA